MCRCRRRRTAGARRRRRWRVAVVSRSCWYSRRYRSVSIVVVLRVALCTCVAAVVWRDESGWSWVTAHDGLPVVAASALAHCAGPKWPGNSNNDGDDGDEPPPSLSHARVPFNFTLHYVIIRRQTHPAFHSIPFHPIPFHPSSFHSISFHSILFHSTLLYSTPLHSIPFRSVPLR